MPTRELTRQEMRAVLSHGGASILRTYHVNMRIVDTVDNQGAQCEFCGNVNAVVAANIYATDMAGQGHCADTCLSCIVYVTDNHIDIDPIFSVVVEIARGVR